jgi:DNA-binding transcriptional LysR family regulator
MPLLSRSLRAFMVVAEELHFGRAATRLNISQPPLSQLIRKFEEDVGAPLFVRTTRSVRLTPAGERLLTHARRIAEENDGAIGAARRATAPNTPRSNSACTKTSRATWPPACWPRPSISRSSGAIRARSIPNSCSNACTARR